MRIAASLIVLCALVVFSGCDDRSATLRLPTAPSVIAAPSPAAPRPPAPVPPGFDTISTSVAIVAITLESGSTVAVRDCPPGPGGTQPTLCTDQLRATFAVRNEGQERDASLRVVFSDATRECGVAWVPRALLVTATPMTFSISTVFLSWEISEGVGTPVTLVQPCQLPVTTTRIMLQMWEGDSRAPVAVQELDRAYTFVR